MDIGNEIEYQEALKRLYVIFNAESGTPEYDEANILALLIGEYEDRNYPIENWIQKNI